MPSNSESSAQREVDELTAVVLLLFLLCEATEGTVYDELTAAYTILGGVVQDIVFLHYKETKELLPRPRLSEDNIDPRSLEEDLSAISDFLQQVNTRFPERVSEAQAHVDLALMTLLTIRRSNTSYGELQSPRSIIGLQ